MKLSGEEKAVLLRDNLSEFVPYQPCLWVLSRRPQASWDSRRNEVEKFVKKNKRLPSKNAESNSEKLMGCWCQNQRQSEGNSQLSEEKKKELELIEGWYWRVRKEDKWDNYFNQLSRFTSGGDISPRANRKKTSKHLIKWCSQQRKNRRNGLLSEEQQNKLNSINGWQWDWDGFIESKWQGSLKKTKVFVKKNGRLPSANRDSNDKEELSLASWCSGQRTIYHKGKLSENHTRALKSIKGWYWGSKSKSWDDRFNMVDAYVKENGVLPWGDVDMARWLNYQRECFRRARYSGKLSSERKQKLNSLPGWSWSRSDTKYIHGKWSRNWNRIVEFVKINGRLPSIGNESEIRLYAWCIAQRRLNGCGELSKLKQKKLESISIWDWDVNSNGVWNSMFQKVRDYVEKNGRVPEFKDEGSGVEKLASWCSRQRNYNYNGKLLEERQRKLTAIKGWYWDKDGRWDSKFEQVENYIKKNGIMPCTGSKDAEIRRLSSWCNVQRIHRGKLSEERQNKLTAIKGWWWNGSSK